MEKMKMGRKSWYRLIPEALKAVISLSPEILPKERSVPKRNAIGMVKMRKEGEMKRRSIKIWVRLTPLVTMSSISFRILSMRRIMVKIIRPMRKIGKTSFRI